MSLTLRHPVLLTSKRKTAVALRHPSREWTTVISIQNTRAGGIPPAFPQRTLHNDLRDTMRNTLSTTSPGPHTHHPTCFIPAISGARRHLDAAASVCTPSQPYGMTVSAAQDHGSLITSFNGLSYKSYDECLRRTDLSTVITARLTAHGQGSEDFEDDLATGQKRRRTINPYPAMSDTDGELEVPTPVKRRIVKLTLRRGRRTSVEERRLEMDRRRRVTRYPAQDYCELDSMAIDSPAPIPVPVSMDLDDSSSSSVPTKSELDSEMDIDQTSSRKTRRERRKEIREAHERSGRTFKKPKKSNVTDRRPTSTESCSIPYSNVWDMSNPPPASFPDYCGLRSTARYRLKARADGPSINLDNPPDDIVSSASPSPSPVLAPVGTASRVEDPFEALIQGLCFVQLDGAFDFITQPDSVSGCNSPAPTPQSYALADPKIRSPCLVASPDSPTPAPAAAPQPPQVPFSLDVILALVDHAIAEVAEDRGLVYDSLAEAALQTPLPSSDSLFGPELPEPPPEPAALSTTPPPPASPVARASTPPELLRTPVWTTPPPCTSAEWLCSTPLQCTATPPLADESTLPTTTPPWPPPLPTPPAAGAMAWCPETPILGSPIELGNVLSSTPWDRSDDLFTRRLFAQPNMDASPVVQQGSSGLFSSTSSPMKISPVIMQQDFLGEDSPLSFASPMVVFDDADDNSMDVSPGFASGFSVVNAVLNCVTKGLTFLRLSLRRPTQLIIVLLRAWGPPFLYLSFTYTLSGARHPVDRGGTTGICGPRAPPWQTASEGITGSNAPSELAPGSLDTTPAQHGDTALERSAQAEVVGLTRSWTPQASGSEVTGNCVQRRHGTVRRLGGDMVAMRLNSPYSMGSTWATGFSDDHDRASKPSSSPVPRERPAGVFALQLSFRKSPVSEAVHESCLFDAKDPTATSLSPASIHFPPAPPASRTP
ncbi:hypothetical protein BV25DRAFT_1842486 [Artomyces pyxidatus]|uniref:Uncharacterized protein n=1 Tax=Artomyces pyxidatus TaxID=48021 RepID=A0ACB8SK94_9AGAM|nr:hypothetical protein BV25DRAFT_1842486 [Artomyces pyxidatus]